MSRIVFENEPPVAQVDPGRADVALFVGLIRCNSGAVLSSALQNWLVLQGWIGSGPFAKIALSGSNPVPITSCVNIPLPIETYTTFTTLFDPGGSAASYGTDYMATAVRSFFAQGGKRCYVVRVGDPVVPFGATGAAPDSDDAKNAKLLAMMPSTIFGIDDQRGWQGAGHLAGLPEVSFLAMPDLAVLIASVAETVTFVNPPPESGPEQFVQCSNADVTPNANRLFGPFAPRLTLDDYSKWAQQVWTVLDYLSGSTSSEREVQFVAAFPLPQTTDVALAAQDPSKAIQFDIQDVIAQCLPETLLSAPGDLNISLSSAFLQLAYPWLKTTGSSVLLEELEPPDGALIGILARNALSRGTFTSATKITPSEIYDLSPVLTGQDTNVSATPLIWGPHSPVKPLIERFSLFGFTPSGLALLSDVTAWPGESYRPARIHRLVSVILRACRNLGQEIVFRNNGPALWALVQNFLTGLLTQLWQLNALDGDTISDAFTVQCDRSTMTQNDLDNGRLIAQVTFNAASTIELIRVTLALETSGTSSQAIALLAEAS